MLTRFRTGLRFRLAMTLALFAALCFVAPPAVLAFGHGANALDCLAHADLMNHGNGATPQKAAHHGDHAPTGKHSAPAGDHQMTCCGLFCLSALAPQIGSLEPNVTVEAPVPAHEPNLFSRVAERLDRPPIALLVV
jgi:hypothetical protein